MSDIYVSLFPNVSAARSETIKDASIMLDYDEYGEIIGIEVLDAEWVTIDGGPRLTGHPLPREVTP